MYKTVGKGDVMLSNPVVNSSPSFNESELYQDMEETLNIFKQDLHDSQYESALNKIRQLKNNEMGSQVNYSILEDVFQNLVEKQDQKGLVRFFSKL